MFKKLIPVIATVGLLFSAITTPAYALNVDTINVGQSALPGTPKGLTAYKTNATFVVLTWGAPTSNGGSLISDYIVQYKKNSSATWLTYTDGVKANSGATVSGLTQNTKYDFRVAAKTAAGTGLYTNLISATTLLSYIPDAPTMLNAMGGVNDAKLTWSAPTTLNGATITDYIVQFKPSNTTTWITLNDPVSAVTGATVPYLDVARSYDFKVAAKSSSGTGPYTAVKTASTMSGRDVPSMPANFAVTGGMADSLVFTWKTPVATGATAIKDYIVLYKEASSLTWIPFNDGVNTNLSGRIGNLKPNTTYNIKVAAQNDDGIGAYTSLAKFVTKTGIPAAPTAPQLSINTSNASANLTWNNPSAYNGGTVTDYVIRYKTLTEQTWTTLEDGISTTKTASLVGMTLGNKYEFQIAAKTAQGVGTFTPSLIADWSGSAAAPANFVPAVKSPTSISATWDAPVQLNGGSLAEYVIAYKERIGTTPPSTVDETWITYATGNVGTGLYELTGLKSGATYDLAVAGKSPVGTMGAYSAIAEVTLNSGAPDQIQPPVVLSAGTSATISWFEPLSNDGPITDYAIYYKTVSASGWTLATDGVSTATTATITGLTPNTDYQFQVKAINAYGQSTPSQTVTDAILPKYTQIETGTGYTCALTQTKLVECWGSMTGTTTPKTIPSLQNVISLSANGNHACAIVEGNTVKCWGQNNYGQLGNMTQEYIVTTPIAVQGLANVTQISTGLGHSCALLSDKTVSCWGINGQGQLGDGTVTSSFSPKAVNGLANVSSISTEKETNCAVLADNTLKCWGSNSFGQINPADNSAVLTPTIVTGLPAIKNVWVNPNRICASSNVDGTVKCWGRLITGKASQDASIANSILIPGNDLGATNLPFNCSLRSDNKVACWGSSLSGSFGNANPPSSQASPVLVSGLAGIVDMDIDAKGNVCVIDAVGASYCWGDNSQGQLGNGSKVNSSVPVTVSK